MNNSLLPKNYYKAVCLISTEDPSVNGWRNYKTAFFWGIPAEPPKWHLFLLSCLDAFQVNGSTAARVFVSRFSPVDGVSTFEIQNNTLFRTDVEGHAAVLELGSLERDLNATDEFLLAANTETIPVDENVQQWEGRLILTPGYPDEKQLLKLDYPIVRGGVIARIGDLMDQLNEWLLIDANVFPAHEGAPVFLQPWPLQVLERTLYTPWLIGMVNQCCHLQAH